jgi:hypothetical protein
VTSYQRYFGFTGLTAYAVLRFRAGEIVKMNSRKAIAALVFACTAALPAFAQTVIKPVERPDPAGLAMPELAFVPSKSDLRNFDEYFYFHKPGVSYERAFADLDQCWGYGLATKLLGDTPSVVPLGGDAIKAPMFKQGVNPGFVVGAILAGAESDKGLISYRRCMTYKGYARYGLSRAIFGQIRKGSDADKLGRLALIASGPQPQAGAIEP